jgi:hypothetical protein
MEKTFLKKPMIEEEAGTKANINPHQSRLAGLA